MPTKDPNVRFARSLLCCFKATEQYAQDRVGIVTNLNIESTSSSESSQRFAAISSRFTTNENSRRQLLKFYRLCILASTDALCDLLCPIPQIETETRERRLELALTDQSNQDVKDKILINTKQLEKFLNNLNNMLQHLHALTGPFESLRIADDQWKPEWRTQNLIWFLVKQLSMTNPPLGEIDNAFADLRNGIFSCLFGSAYLESIRKKSEFRHTLLQCIPYPGKWEADLSWAGSALYISLPLASHVYSWRGWNNVQTFWFTFMILFLPLATCFLFLFSLYKSFYSKNLLANAATGLSLEEKYFRSFKKQSSMISETPVSLDGQNSNVRSLDEQLEHDSSQSHSESVVESDIEAPSERLTGNWLRLYQATMFVERSYGSTYLDPCWTLGLTADQLYNAIKMVLTTSSALGRNVAAFSFTSLAIASRGVPDPGITQVDLTGAERASQLYFAIFSFMGALAFTCGTLSSTLSDHILRQMEFTQVKQDGTSHGFVEKVGFFVRAVGGLNSVAMVSLFTGVMVALISIFRVHLAAAIPLGLSWLILGTLLVESFFIKFHFWNLVEIFDDVGSVITDPEILSPSPFTGFFQIVLRQCKLFFRRTLKPIKTKKTYSQRNCKRERKLNRNVET